MFTALTWTGHATLQLLEGLSSQGADLVPESLSAVEREVPQARPPLALPAQLVGGLAEAAAEAQVMANGVFPAVGSGLEERKVLPGQGKEIKTYKGTRTNPRAIKSFLLITNQLMKSSCGRGGGKIRL